MALKITTQIGTDRGVTSDAYVRISEYQVSKRGSANFKIQLFMNQTDSVSGNSIYPLSVISKQASNQQIGEELQVSLTKNVESTITIQKSVEVVIPAVLAEDGTVITPESSTLEMQDVEETYTIAVPDLSSLEDGTIFAFAYNKLKEKLVELFGADNVVDC